MNKSERDSGGEPSETETAASCDSCPYSISVERAEEIAALRDQEREPGQDFTEVEDIAREEGGNHEHVCSGDGEVTIHV